MFNNIPPAGFPQIDLSQDVKRITAEISGMASDCTNILTDITAETVTVSGNPITLSDALATDAISVVAEIEPEQDLHGYDKPWSGGAGKNKLPITLETLKSLNASGTWTNNVYNYRSVNITVYTDDGGNVTRINANGTATGGNIYFRLVPNTYDIVADTILNGCASGGSDTTFAIVAFESDDTTAFAWDIGNGVGISAAHTDVNMYIRVAQGTSVNKDFYPMIRLATETDATFEPYTNICPISGMDSVNVTATDGTDTNTATITIGQTVYGGTVDFETGVMTITHAIVDLGSLNWEKVSSATNAFYTSGLSGFKYGSLVGDKAFATFAICSSYAYTSGDPDFNDSSGNFYLYYWATTESNRLWVVDNSKDGMIASNFKTAVTGQKICYELATHPTLSLTPTTLAMLEGENEVSTDAEEVSVEYIKNTLVGRVRRLEEEQ